MKNITLAVAVAALLGAGLASAQSGPDVVKAKCAGCHDAETKKVGPSQKDIAAKYKGSNDATGALVARLKDGKGHMKVAASDAELTAAVQQFLSQAK